MSNNTKQVSKEYYNTYNKVASDLLFKITMYNKSTSGLIADTKEIE